MNRILTMEDLVRFCASNKIYNFSSKDSGKPIVVQAIQDFSSSEIEESDDGMMYAKVRVCHTLLNRNGSFASEENMKNAMPSLKYRPFLAKIHQLDDGTWGFHSHDMHIEKDENGNETIIYDESQVGTFTADEPYLEYDKEMDKTYVVAKVAIPEEYTKAADIIRANGGTKVSCELVIYDLAYNAKEKYLELINFRFNGCTALGYEKDGTEIGEGMLGSKLTLEDFSEDNNSIIKFNEQVIKMQEKLDKLISHFDINTNKEGGKTVKFDELLNKYGKTVDDIDFDYKNMSDDELKAKFEELFGEDESDEGSEETNDNPEPSDDGEGDDASTKENEACGGKKKKKKCDLEDLTKTFEISHEDIRCGLYNLLGSFEESDNEWYWISNVYDDYFVYENFSCSKIFGQKYTKDGDNVTFEGERWELFKELLTASEKAELESMRSNYAELKEFKENADAAALHAEREAVLKDGKFASIKETEEFKKLYSEMDKYSVEEIEVKAKVILADSYAATFAAKPETKPNKVNLSLKDENESPYGNLF